MTNFSNSLALCSNFWCSWVVFWEGFLERPAHERPSNSQDRTKDLLKSPDANSRFIRCKAGKETATAETLGS